MLFRSVSTQKVQGVNVSAHKSLPIAGRALVERRAPDNAKDPSGSRLEPLPGVDFTGLSTELQVMGLLTRRSGATGEFHLEGSIDGQTYLTKIQAPKVFMSTGSRKMAARSPARLSPSREGPVRWKFCFATMAGALMGW